MRTSSSKLLCACLGAIAAGCGGKGDDGPRSVDAAYIVPSGYSASRPTPLLVFLHGYGPPGDPIAGYSAWLRLQEAAEARTVLVALPRGDLDPSGAYYWNGANCCRGSPDHVAYLRAVVAQASARYSVDPKRIYFAGHSNGGCMAHRMGCEAADLVAGIAAIAGDAWKDPARCRPAAPVAVLQVHGDADGTIPYAGSGDYPSARASVATWAALDHCGAALVDTGSRLDLDDAVPGAETWVERHDCQDGAAELWTMRGSSHIPTFRAPEAMLALLDWLLAHPKP